MSALIAASSPRSRRVLWPLLFLLAVLTAGPSDATRMRSVPLEERARKAERIVVGRVTGARVGTHPRYPRVVVTHVTLRVRETWKGAPAEVVTFMQFGDAAGGTPKEREGRVRMPRIPGLPTYTVGEEVLLFLFPPSDAGLTSPVGGAGGKIRVRRDAATGAPSVEEAVLERGQIAPATDATVSLARARERVQASLREEGGRR